MKRIGLFGGTFDPPHIGHLEIGKTVLKSLELDAVWYIPTFEPPHKDAATATPHQRLEMLKILLEGQERLSISTIEYEREGLSYTIDTVQALLDDHPDTSFYFIIGGDMIAYLPNWHRVEELKQLIQFVGVRREGYSIDDEQGILKVNIPELPYSSTDIRKAISANQPVEGLTDGVYDYIRENKLYER